MLKRKRLKPCSFDAQLDDQKNEVSEDEKKSNLYMHI